MKTKTIAREELEREALRLANFGLAKVGSYERAGPEHVRIDDDPAFAHLRQDGDRFRGPKDEVDSFIMCCAAMTLRCLRRSLSS
jgi:hypothetical protein